MNQRKAGGASGLQGGIEFTRRHGRKVRVWRGSSAKVGIAGRAVVNFKIKRTRKLKTGLYTHGAAGRMVMRRFTNVHARRLEVVIRDAADGLPPAQSAALVAHPEAVGSALAAAAETLSAKPGRRSAAAETLAAAEPVRVGPAEADRRLSERTRAGAPETLLTSEELATRVGLKTRQSVHDWLKKGRIVGWQGARRGYVFPARQLDDRNRPLPGIDRVIPQFGDSYAGWVWLTTPWPSLDGTTPLALLGRGEVDRVTEAAQGYQQGDFA